MGVPVKCFTPFSWESQRSCIMGWWVNLCQQHTATYGKYFISLDSWQPTGVVISHTSLYCVVPAIHISLKRLTHSHSKVTFFSLCFLKLILHFECFSSPQPVLSDYLFDKFTVRSEALWTADQESAVICIFNNFRNYMRNSSDGLWLHGKWNREEQRGLIPEGLKSNHKTNMIIEI